MTRLRWLLVIFFVALAVPSTVLVWQAYRQMRSEAFHQHRLRAEELTNRIDAKLASVLEIEEARSSADYDFLIVTGDNTANFVAPSELSRFPVSGRVPGLLAYFQVDMQGRFSTPSLPQSFEEAVSYGIGAQEYQERLALGHKVHALLSEKNLVRRQLPRSPALDSVVPEEEAKKADSVTAGESLASRTYEYLQDSQQAFSELQKRSRQLPEAASLDESQGVGRVDDFELDDGYAVTDEVLLEQSLAEPVPSKTREKRKEQVALQSEAGEQDVLDSTVQFLAVPVSTFDTELEPFDFALLDDEHFVMFRRVFRGGERFVQGAIIDRSSFVEDSIRREYLATNLSRVSDLAVGFQGNTLRVMSAAPALAGSLLYRAALSAPFAELEVVFSVRNLPLGPGGRTLAWSALVLSLVLVLGFTVVYRLGVSQIRLNRQQQDFVAAVSHELKTPLTSIRMYGEMLREGWVNEEKTKSYYDFIVFESERLSRLIANVLQLARLTRRETRLELKPCSVAELLDVVRSSVASQIERAGFQLSETHSSSALQAQVAVDSDAFLQVFINLFDNALKFSADSEPKIVDFSCNLQTDGRLLFSVRDYGPGVAKGQLKKIFRLFYRTEDELTRETVGTGIGLALVTQLVSAMGGQVDIINREPGAQCRVFLPALD